MNIIQFLTNKKYRFFYNKLQHVQYSIWDLEFKVQKSRQVREGVRQDRDRAIESTQHLETALKNPELTKEQKEKLEADKMTHTENVGRFEKQMKMIDDQIQGVPAVPATETSEGNPGVQGINETIASYVELREMYKQFLTTL